MHKYLIELLIVSFASGIIEILCEKAKGGIGKTVSLVTSLVLLYYLLSPIVTLLQDGSLEAVMPEHHTPETEINNKEDNSLLYESEKLIENREKVKIQKKYSLTDDDFSLDVTLSDDGESFSVKSVLLHVRTLKALAREKDIAEILEDDLLIAVTVSEDL